MDLQTAWKEKSEELRLAGVPESKLDAWYLLEYVTGVSKAGYLTDPGKALTETQEKQFLELTEKRKQRIPLQHLTGVQEFMGYEFRVGPDVLIPRQDTEILVETAADRLQDNLQILDLCTGSGCILISLLKLAEEKKLQHIRGIGTDVSAEALQIAEENAKRFLMPEKCGVGKEKAVEAVFSRGDLWDAVGAQEKFDLIVSNPPYIPTETIRGLEEEVKLHDPMLALDGGEDGLIFYRRICEGAGIHLKKGGYLIFEIGADQGEAVSSLMERAGLKVEGIKKDLAGLDRVVTGVYDKERTVQQGEKSYV